jgi:predicted 2-oxoglutarate/Fe(II)-dependent dioxygenase YbiX
MSEPPILQQTAPVLFVPEVLDDALCAELMAKLEEHHEASGMLREVDGAIKLVPDPSAKIRRDHTLDDETLTDQVMRRLAERVLPAIHQAFFYRVTRLEKLKIVRYDATGGGYFRAHRDNTTPDAAHRRFALTLNLNTGAYEGGALRFPEFGEALYEAPKGGACVFSCSLLHEATDVTRGSRYALLTFFYGEDAFRRPAR